MRYFLIISILILFGCKTNNRQVTLLFDRVDGLKVGAPVVCRGLEIGHVDFMDLYGNQVLVKVKLDKPFDIPTGSKFIIYPSLLGQQTLTLETSQNSNKFITSKDTLPGLINEQPKLEDAVKDSIMRSRTLQALGTFLKELSVKKDSIHRDDK